MLGSIDLNFLPDKPGVYFFWNKDEILYIGKATNLKDRVKSYLSKDIFETRGPKIEKMVSLVNKITYIETDSVLDALIQEARLIKKYQPPYNTREKDDKSYNYIAITKEDFPRVFITREREILKNNLLGEPIKFTLYGPFPHGHIMREALRILRKIFPFRDLKSNSKYYDNFYKQLKLSPKLDSENAKIEYNQVITDLKDFLKGNKKKLVKELEKRMLNYAKEQNFEKANEVKRTIYALKHIQDIALIKDDLKEKSGTVERIEAFDIAHLSGKNTVGVMVVLTNNEKDFGQYRKFKIKSNTAGNDLLALEELVHRRFEHLEWKIPTLIVGDGGSMQKRVIEKVLRDKKLNIPVVMVVKDEKHKPKNLIGSKEFITKYESQILLANSEAHRFAIEYYRMLERSKFKNL